MKIEEDIAKRFVSELYLIKKVNIFNDTPNRINYKKVLKYIKNRSEYNLFSILVNLKLNKERNITKYVLDEFKRSNGNKRKIYAVLNILKIFDKYDLVEKYLNLASKKIKKMRPLFEKLIESENIVTLIRNNSYSKETVKEIFDNNKEKINNNDVILNHIGDTFTYDESLTKLKNIFNNFSNELPKNVIDSEDVSITLNSQEDQMDWDKKNSYKNSYYFEEGDTSKIRLNEDYLNENISKRKKRTELNEIDLLLMSLFNMIQSLESKEIFVKYIRDNEYENFENDEFYTLSDRYELFKSGELNDLNVEINNLGKSVDEYHKVNFHLRNLQEDALFGINKIVRRELILKMLIRKSINIIFHLNKDIVERDILYLLSKEVEKDEVDINILLTTLNDLKSSRKRSKKIMKEIEITLLDNLIKHYVEIDKEKKFEKKLINKIILDIKGRPYEEKIQILESIDSFLSKQMKNSYNKGIFNQLITYWIDLYKKLGKINLLSDEELLYQIQNEFFQNHDIAKLKARLKNLPDDKKFYFISQLSLNPKFDIFYSEIKEILFNIQGGSLLNNVILKIKNIEKQLGFDKCINFLDDLILKFSLSKGDNYFMVKKLEIFKNNIIQMKEEKISNLDVIKRKISGCKTILEKIVLLKSMLKDPVHKNFYSYIKTQQYTLIKNNLDLLLKEIGYLSIENQKNIFDSLFFDLKEIFKNDPKSYNIISEKFASIKMFLKDNKKDDDFDDGFSDFILQDERSRIDGFFAKQEDDSDKGIRIIRGKEITVMGGDLSHIYHSGVDRKPEIKLFLQKIREEIEIINSPVDKLKKLDLWKKNLLKDKTKNSQFITVIDNYMQKINTSDEYGQELDDYLLKDVKSELMRAKNKQAFLRERLLDPKYKRIRAVISTLISKLEKS